MPTKSMVASKVADINRLLSHQFTKEELDEKLRKQGSYDNRAKFFKRIEVENSIKIARSMGDDSEVEKLEVQLEEFVGPKLAFGASLFKPQHGKQTEQERLAEINLRNQKLNYESVRRAQVEEKKASRKAVVSATRAETTIDKAKSKNLEVPKLEDGAGIVRSRTGTPDGSVASGRGTPSNGPKKQKGGISMIRHRNKDDENIAALDLDIDIDI